MQPPRTLLILAATLHALLMWAAFEFTFLWPLVMLAPVPLAWLAIRAPSTRFALLLAIGSQLLLWAVVSRWMASVTIIGFPFYVLAMAALNGGLFVWVFRRLHVSGFAPTAVTSRLPMALTLPIVWVAVEALRGEVIADGYAWYFLAHPIVEAPIAAQSADLFGAYFISFLVAMVAGAILDVMRWRGGESRLRQSASGVIAAACIVAVNLGYGAWRLNQTQHLEPGPSMLVIQTNLPQDNKIRWTAEQQVRDLTSFLQLTINAYEELTQQDKRVDLVVWPETMLPGYGLEPDTIAYLKENNFSLPVEFAEAIVAVQRMIDTPMLVGSPAVLGLTMHDLGDGTARPEWEANYNSVYLVHGDPPFERYDKSFLTPFGETMPYFSNWPALEERLLAFGARGMEFDLDRNPELNLIHLNWQGGTARLATPICFESTVGWLNRMFVYSNGEKRADAIINVTNDGWFGFHGAGRIQHAQISRYRAIENRVPVVRSANTGVSVSIDSAGRLIGSIGAGSYGTPQQAEYLYTGIAFDARSTLYGRIGDLWAWLCVAVAAACLAATWIGRRHEARAANRQT